MSKIYKNDVGTVFQVGVGTDVSGATTTDLKVKKPRGTVVTWEGTVNGSVNTQIDYTIVQGDLNEVGVYELQAYVESNSWTGRGETVEFTVYDYFD